MNCTSTPSPTPSPKKNRIFLALEVIGPLLLIVALIYCGLVWKKKRNRRKRATVAPETLAPAVDAMADSQQQPPIMSQPLPAAGTLPDLTNQIKRQGDYPTARGGHSDVYKALWYRNAEAQQTSSTETGIPMEVHVKVAIKVLRLSSTDEDEARKLNKVRMPHMPIPMTKLTMIH